MQLTLALGTGSVLLALLGAAVLAAALGWRWRQGHLVRRRIRQTLRHSHPQVRRSGIELAVDRGLASSADLLLSVARTEQDPHVLAALVHGIARRQWEPASTPRIVELRLWAKAYVEANEHLRASYERAMQAGTTPSGTTPSGTTPSGTTSPATSPAYAGNLAAAPGAPDRSDGREGRSFAGGPARRSSDATAVELARIGAVVDPGSAGALPADRPALRVLVTGGGGPAGVAVIRDLVAHGHHVIAVDADELAVGLRLAHEAHVVARADEPSFVPSLWRVVQQSAPQALLCTVAEEYAALHPMRGMLDEAGVATLFPSLESVLACIDKWRFAEVAAELSLPVPPTGLGAAAGVPGPPWVVKPRHGRGSRDVHVVRAASKLSAALRQTPEPIVQPLLPGAEFTADALVAADGEVVAVVPRWRLETRAGISTKGRTFDDPEVTKRVTQVLEGLHLVGPANVQGFVDEAGNVMIHEVNPRFSGGLPLSLHAGADLVEEYLRMVVGAPVDRSRLTHRPDVVMLRHFTEVFEG